MLNRRLGRLVGLLLGAGAPDPAAAAEARLQDEAIELVVDIVEPRVKLHRGYRRRLRRGVATTIAYLRRLASQPGEPLALSRAAWAEDPRVNAFFATPDDVRAVLGRSRELRAFFARPEEAQTTEAYALLGMKREDRTVLANVLEQGVLRRDVLRTSVSFSEHRLTAPARIRAEVLREVGRRMLCALGQIALGRIIALDRAANRLEREKAYLAARLRLLNLARDGMQGIVEDPATLDAQVAAVERQLSDTLEEFIEARSALATLEGYMDQIDAVFSHPEQHLTLHWAPLRVNRLGLKVDGADAEPGQELLVAEFALGETGRGVVALARCPRSEMPPEEDLLAGAERLL